MMRGIYGIWGAAVIFTGLAAAAADAQVRPVYDQGTNALVRQLQRLQTTASILHTGAHPDDEDSALVAYHARRQNARTAYLSLTRGSGGQNIIGPEQSDYLGVIRTEELLQARRLDGAEQLFTRANDFGFSKYLSEASRLWNEEVVLGDMVRAIRRFRPDVVVSRWSGTPADGHGHHQFAGYLTPQAIEAAADPNRFTAQFAAGISPWRVPKFYISQRVEEASSGMPSLVVDTGEFDVITGRSYFEIGMEGRSQQKTQQMGSLELRGRQLSAMRLIKSHTDKQEPEQSVFDGLDVSIRGIARFEPDPRAEFLPSLARLDGAAAEAISRFNLLDPGALVPTLVEGLSIARETHSLAKGPDTRRLLLEKIGEFEHALVLAAGISVDALADTETVVPGSTAQVAVRIYGAAGLDTSSADVRLVMPAGWTAVSSDAELLPNERPGRRQDQADSQFLFDVHIPGTAEFTQPYWLRTPRHGFTYDWTDAGLAKNLPFDSPPLTAETRLVVSGAPITVHTEVQYRYADPIRGEVRRRIDVVPIVSVDPATDLVIVAATSANRQFDVQLALRNNADHEITGTAGFGLPDGWILDPASTGFALPANPASTTLSFSVTMPDNIVAGEYRLQGVATVGSVVFDQSMREIAYPHIRTHRVYSNSTTTYKVIDVDVAPVRIGYIMGSGDKVPEALRRLGLNVTLMDNAAIATSDLSRFDTIVIGIRASQTRPAYVANNSRLIDFVERGGTLIVQYQQPDFIEKGLAPFPASMDGNVRVVDETAPVIILEPGHAVFNFPNRIDATDFDGWIQERNNYNFTSFDRAHYIPLTESHDDGEPDSDGGMLYAKIGDGHYVYTSYSWFRQLPNGTPGAYRLFANLLSIPAAPN